MDKKAANFKEMLQEDNYFSRLDFENDTTRQAFNHAISESLARTALFTMKLDEDYQSPAQIIKQLDSLKGHLQKAVDILVNELPSHIENQLSSLLPAEIRKQVYKSLGPDYWERKAGNHGEPEATLITNYILNAIPDAAKNTYTLLDELGPGRAGSTKFNNIDGFLHQLIGITKLTLPHIKPSKDENSIFFQIASHLLSNYLNYQQNPRRRIASVISTTKAGT